MKLKKRQENLEARRKWREQGPVDDGYEARQGVTLADLDDKKEKTTTQIFSCAACKKTFKSEKQYANHCLSKAHKKKAGSSAPPPPPPQKPRVDSFDVGFFSATSNDAAIAAALESDDDEEDVDAVFDGGDPDAIAAMKDRLEAAAAAAEASSRLPEEDEEPPPRLWALSDVHTDHSENLDWLKRVCARTDLRRDGLILSGDVSSRFSILRETLQLCKRAFAEVSFVPGNHDVWVTRGEPW